MKKTIDQELVYELVEEGMKSQQTRKNSILIDYEACGQVCRMGGLKDSPSISSFRNSGFEN